MSRIEPTLIDNSTTLVTHLAASRITLRWHIPPEAGRLIHLSPTQLELFVDDTPIAPSPIGDSFKEFVCESIGEIKHTPGTTNSATGTLTLSTCLSDRMLDIDYEYVESPANIESCFSGGGFISTSLSDFVIKHNGG